MGVGVGACEVVVKISKIDYYLVKFGAISPTLFYTLLYIICYFVTIQLFLVLKS